MSGHRQTPSQTIGPFFHDALMSPARDRLDPGGVAGQPIVVHGEVRDGTGAPVGDAMLEIWQADGGGRYRHPADPRAGQVPEGFLGFGRVATDREHGRYRATTVMPGQVPGAGGQPQAPHLNVLVFARGLLHHLHTRIYFPGALEGGLDAALAGVPEPRRATLVARAEEPVDGVPHFRFDIRLQGDGETVFFDA